MRKLNLTGGLTDAQAEEVEHVLRRAGAIGDINDFALQVGMDAQKVRNFIKTKRARVAAEQSTDLSQKLYHDELVRKAAERKKKTALTVTLNEQVTLANGLSTIDDGDLGRNFRKSNKTEESRWIKSQAPEMTDEEIAKWDKLANTPSRKSAS